MLYHIDQTMTMEKETTKTSLLTQTICLSITWIASLSMTRWQLRKKMTLPQYNLGLKQTTWNQITITGSKMDA
jgi:hypothetical protein